MHRSTHAMARRSSARCPVIMFCNLLDIESDRHLSPTTQTIPVHKVWIVLLMFEKGEREFSGIMYVKESDRAILYTAVIY